jgi:hypothetical protein
VLVPGAHRGHYSVMSNRHPMRDAGSRGFLDVWRHPVAAFTAPFRGGAKATDADRVAASSSDGVEVTCFARATFAPFPSGWKKGLLHLDARGARWSPGVARGDGTPLPLPIHVLLVREVKGAETLHLKARFFQVIETTCDHGDLRLGVPRDSAPLVVERIKADCP